MAAVTSRGHDRPLAHRRVLEGPAGFGARFLKGLRDSLLAIAGQAYATEQIINEFSGDLGADVLRPEARALLEQTLDRVFRLLKDLEPWVGEIDVPSEIEIDLYLADARTVVESARRRR